MQSTVQKHGVAAQMAVRPAAGTRRAFAAPAQASIARPSFAKRMQRGMTASRVESQRVVVVRAADDKVSCGRNARSPRPSPMLTASWAAVGGAGAGHKRRSWAASAPRRRHPAAALCASALTPPVPVPCRWW